MKFWNRDDGDERSKYQTSERETPPRTEMPPQAERPTAREEFNAYFKTVRQAQPTESGERSGADSPDTVGGMLRLFASRFRAEPGPAGTPPARAAGPANSVPETVPPPASSEAAAPDGGREETP